MVGFSAFAEGGGGWRVSHFAPKTYIYIYIHANQTFPSFFKSQKQPQNKLFLRLKNNFCRSQKSFQKA